MKFVKLFCTCQSEEQGAWVRFDLKDANSNRDKVGEKTETMTITKRPAAGVQTLDSRHVHEHQAVSPSSF